MKKCLRSYLDVRAEAVMRQVINNRTAAIDGTEKYPESAYCVRLCDGGLITRWRVA